MNFYVAGLITLTGFYALFFFGAVYIARARRVESHSDELLLAGRNLPLFLGILTMTATWVDGGYINGTAEAVFDPKRGLVWAQAPWGYGLSLILGGMIFAIPMRRLRFHTMLDLFELRFNKRVAAVLFIPALMGELLWSAAILAALGTTLAVVLDVDVNWSIVVSAIIAITYIVIGGLWSVSFTNALQMICIVIGLCMAVPFVFQYTSGYEAAWTLYQQKFGDAASLIPPITWFDGTDKLKGYSGWQWADLGLLLILGGIPWQVYFQRVFACRDERTAASFSIGAGLLCILMAIPPAMMGIAAAVTDWSQTEVGTAPPEILLTLPYTLRYLTPPWIAALGLGAVAAAVMSSVDSSVLSAASMFACNVYKPLINPQATDRNLRWMLRIAIVVVGLAAAWLAVAVGSVYTLFVLCSDLVYVILFPQLVLALFYSRTNTIGSVCGIIVGLILRVGGGESSLGIPALIPYPLTNSEGVSDFPFRTLAMLASLVTIFLVSNLTQQRCPPRPLTR